MRIKNQLVSSADSSVMDAPIISRYAVRRGEGEPVNSRRTSSRVYVFAGDLRKTVRMLLAGAEKARSYRLNEIVVPKDQIRAGADIVLQISDHTIIDLS